MPGRQAAGEYFNPSKNLLLRRRPPSGEAYCVFGVPEELPELPVELPLELPEPMLPLLEPLLGEVVELGDVVELLPPLAAPEPDLLKCASHSARET